MQDQQPFYRLPEAATFAAWDAGRGRFTVEHGETTAGLS
jgi:hypothetical protein